MKEKLIKQIIGHVSDAKTYLMNDVKLDKFYYLGVIMGLLTVLSNIIDNEETGTGQLYTVNE